MKKKLSTQDIAYHLALNADTSKKDADAFVRAFFEVVEEGLREDNFVKIKGFGTFKLVSVNERESVNVNTGERIHISGHTKVTFTPDTQMKELVNRPFAHFETVDLNDDTDVSEFEVIDEEMERTEDEEEEELNEIETFAGESEGEAESEADELDDTAEPQTTSAQPIAGNEQLTAPIELMDEAASPTCQTASLEQPTPRTLIEDEEEQTTQVSPEDSLQQGVLVELSSVPNAPIASTVSTSSEAETAEEIVVTAPAPIVDNSITSAEASTSETISAADEEQPASTEEKVEESPSSVTDVPMANPTNATVGYTYGEVPLPKPRRNWWKVLALVLGVFILMVASYFVGYYRILCPTCYDMHWPFTHQAEQPVPPMPAFVPQKAMPTPPQTPQTMETQPATIANDSVQNASAAAGKSEKSVPSASNEQKQSLEKKNTPTTSQLAVSRPKTHCVKVGDNLYRIARKYYGSDKYVQKIIEANHLKDADNITVGKDIVLP